jgi:hypothetical protein
MVMGSLFSILCLLKDKGIQTPIAILLSLRREAFRSGLLRRLKPMTILGRLKMV